MNDKYTNERISGLHPKCIETFTNFIDECETQFKITLRIVQGFRSFAEQDALYAQGRTTTGKIVTQAKGGESYHCYGMAIDLAEVMADGQINWNFDYSMLVPIANKYGLTWGGSFVTFRDKPHFEMSFGHGPAGWRYFLNLHNFGQVDTNGFVVIPETIV